MSKLVCLFAVGMQGGMVTNMGGMQTPQQRMQMQQMGSMQPMDPSAMQQARMMRGQMRPQQGNLRQVNIWINVNHWLDSNPGFKKIISDPSKSRTTAAVPANAPGWHDSGKAPRNDGSRTRWCSSTTATTTTWSIWSARIRRPEKPVEIKNGCVFKRSETLFLLNHDIYVFLQCRSVHKKE